MAFAGEPDPLPVVDAGRDLDLSPPLLELLAGALAIAARMLDHSAGATAGRTRLRSDELAEGAPGDPLEAPLSLAGRADADAGPRLDARRFTASARHGDLERHLALRPARGLHERDLHLGGDVGTTRSRAHRGREEIVAEERREDVGQAPEVEVRRLEAPTAEAGVAEAVVQLPSLGLGEHLVRLHDLLEALVGVRSLGHVRMQLARQPAERLLDLCLVRVPADAQHLVVIPLSGCHCGKRSRGPG